MITFLPLSFLQFLAGLGGNKNNKSSVRRQSPSSNVSNYGCSSMLFIVDIIQPHANLFPFCFLIFFLLLLLLLLPHHYFIFISCFFLLFRFFLKYRCERNSSKVTAEEAKENRRMLPLLHETLQQDILDHGVTVLRFLVGTLKDDYVFTIAVSSIFWQDGGTKNNKSSV